MREGRSPDFGTSTFNHTASINDLEYIDRLRPTKGRSLGKKRKMKTALINSHVSQFKRKPWFVLEIINQRRTSAGKTEKKSSSADGGLCLCTRRLARQGDPINGLLQHLHKFLLQTSFFRHVTIFPSSVQRQRHQNGFDAAAWKLGIGQSGLAEQSRINSTIARDERTPWD